MANGVGKQWRAGQDTRTTTRWSDEERAWLELRAVESGRGVGTVVRGLVRVAMAGVVPASAEQIARSAAGAAGTAGVVRRVPGAAAPSSPSGAAAPPRGGTRLEIVVARMLDGGGVGPVPPVRLMQARAAIRAGRVRVSGRPVSGGALDPGTLVGPGEVELDA